MEHFKPGQFYEILPDGRYHFVLDNHLLHTHNTCDRLFDFKHNKLWRTKRVGTALSIGSWWSRYLELYYNEMSHNENISDECALKFAADAWVEHKMETEFKLQKQKDYDKFGGWEGAAVMSLDYHRKYGEHDMRNWKILAAEAGFGLAQEVFVGQNDEVVVHWSGKPDLFIYESASGKAMPVDHKTLAYVRGDTILKYKPHSQLTGYVFAGKQLCTALGFEASICDRAIVNVAARGVPSDKPRDGIKKPRFVRVFPNYSGGELEEWRNDIIEKACRLRRSFEFSTWPGRDSACHLYNGCDFRRACSVPLGSRELVLKADYIQVQPWAPYEKDVDETDED